MKWVVTRQCYWPTGEYVVEIAAGGIDYCNPDALVKKYAGEFEEYDNPIEAVETAIEICRQWRRDGQKDAKLAMGCTGGYTMPFDTETFEGCRKAARKIFDELPKCDICGEILPKEYYTDEFGEGKYCREYCADKAIQEYERMAQNE